MSGAVLSVGGAVLVVMMAAYGAVHAWRRLMAVPAVVKEPKPCEHQWAPWSEPKEVEVSETTTAIYAYTSSGHKIAKDFKGVFQERLCEKCNIYERRWA